MWTGRALWSRCRPSLRSFRPIGRGFRKSFSCGKPRHSRGYVAENLVWDGAGLYCHLFDCYRFFALRAYQDSFVARCNALDIGYVYHGEVHAYASGYGRTPASYQDLPFARKGEGKTVAVADRKGGDKALFLRHEGSRIAYGRARGHFLNLHYLGLQFHDRL